MTPVSLTTLLLHSDGEKAFIGRLDLAKAFDHVHPAHVCCLFRHLVILPKVVKLFGGLGLEPAVFLYLYLYHKPESLEVVDEVTAVVAALPLSQAWCMAWVLIL